MWKVESKKFTPLEFLRGGKYKVQCLKFNV